MREHLADDGLIAFETRNPVIDWPARWHRNAVLKMGDESIVQSRRVLKKKDNRISFETQYVFSDKNLVSCDDFLR
jgi:hypothetical protein